MKRCWAGIRASDALYTGGYFDYVATFYGAPNSFGRRVDYRLSNDGIVNRTIDEQVCKLKESCLDLEVVAYNPCHLDLLMGHGGTDCIVLASKIEFRRIMGESGIPALEAEWIPADVKDVYRYIVDREGNGTFVVQCDRSSGGECTYLLNEGNATYINGALAGRNGHWFYSRYRDRSIPVNMHLIISDEEVYLSPGSIQVTRVCGCRILYRGADFIAYRDLSPSARQKMSDCTRMVGEIVQSRGYRGVAGIDAIIDGDDVIMVEANLRYQASTFLINKEIQDRVAAGEMQWLSPETGKQISMHMLGDAARKGCRLSDIISQDELENLKMGYSFCTYIAEDSYSPDIEPYPGYRDENQVMGIQWRHTLHALRDGVDAEESIDVSIEDWQNQFGVARGEFVGGFKRRYTLITDGFDERSSIPEPYSYLYKVVVNARIIPEDFLGILYGQESRCGHGTDSQDLPMLW